MGRFRDSAWAMIRKYSAAIEAQGLVSGRDMARKTRKIIRAMQAEEIRDE